LSKATAEALVHNPALQAAQDAWQAKVEQARMDAAWDDPRLSFRSLLGRFTAVSRNGFTDQAVSLEQSLPLSGKNRCRARAALAEAAASFEIYRRQQLDLVAQVRRVYFQLLSFDEQLALNQADAASLDQTLALTRARFEAGAGLAADVTAAETERGQLLDARQDLQQRRVEAEARLKVLLNRDPFAPLPALVPAALRAGVPAEPTLRAKLLANRPEIREAQAQLAASRAREELARREWIPDPTVSLQADHYNGSSQIASEVSGGISVSLPWLNGGKYRAGERQGLAQTAHAAALLQAAQAEGLGKLRSQLGAIAALHHHLELYEGRLLPSARQSAAAYQADYENAKAGLAEVLSAGRNARALEARRQADLADYRSALADLEALVGAELGAFPATTVTSRRTTP
jgi:outer membrane protein TolC